ncbi:asparagine synthase C-terminal domain-containing protein [Luteimonas sp. TWI662]|uniref:asparagine synthase C-terminal domain-containing protein n=1 Tax=Luteimonas sp. TWI662 TaxID=3136789 RepID=UPI0032092377
MQGAYLAVYGDAATQAVALPHLREYFAAPGFALYGTPDLKLCRIGGDACLIGEVFDRDGKPVDPTSLAIHHKPEQLRNYLLQQLWGCYLLLQVDGAQMIATLSPAAAGNVPCVYSGNNRRGFLTSDISLAIEAGCYERRVDWEALGHRLLYPGIKPQNTALAGLKELLPGTSLHVEPSGISVRQAWSPWNFVGPSARHATADEAAQSVRQAVEYAVRALATTDGSTLLELSGGLDSSIVGACLVGAPCEVVCVNLLTPVPGVDERHYAEQVARALGTPLHVEPLPFERARLAFQPSPASVLPGMGPLQHAIDGIMSEAADRHGVRSYVSGGGGDSVFCYLRTAAPAVDAFKVSGLGAALATVGDLSRMHQCTFWKAARLTLSKLRRTPGPPHRANTTFLDSRLGDIPPFAHPWFSAPDGALPGDRERIIDLAGNQLFQGQAARAQTRPFRFPLLSQPVMEACLRAPTWMWIAGGQNRAVARAAFSHKLPAEVLHRQSKATYIGYLGAVYQQRKHEIGTFLLEGQLAERGLLDAASIRTFLRSPLPARDQTFLRLFELCMIENWARHQP